METLSLGTFIFINALAVGTFAFCVYTRMGLARYLLILPMMFFFVLSFYMVGDYQVATVQTEVITNGIDSWNSTRNEIVITDFDTNWLVWVYLVLGMFCLILMLYLWRKP